MKWFKRGDRISLNHVRDKIYAVEGDEELELRIDEDAMMMARRIKKVLGDIDKAKENPDMIENAAVRFARAVFGVEQAEKLTAFYNGNVYAVFEFTSKYFTSRLTDKITRAQKNAKVI